MTQTKGKLSNWIKKLAIVITILTTVTLIFSTILGFKRFSEVFNEHLSSPLYHLRTISEVTNKNVCVKLLEEVNANYSYLGNRNYSDNEVCQIIDAVKFSGTVKSKLTSPVITSCITAVQLSRWLNELGAKSVEHVGSYNCRKIRNSQKLSEHSFGKAIDISRLDDAVLEDHWNDSGAKGKKLRQAAKLACKYFTNVLTPNSNSLHKDHFHFDNKAGLYTRWHYWFGCK
jgi:Uncharacterized protein conserved in bacteria